MEQMYSGDKVRVLNLLEYSWKMKKKGLNKRTVLHELYHHLVDSYGLDLLVKVEEREANSYTEVFFKRRIP